MLHLVQSEDGYVSPRGIAFCAAHLGLTTAEVSAVATFYTQYKRHPNGTYTVGVCTNTLCAIMGGDAIWEDLSDHLGVGHDETTDDGAITLERVECNAACDYAPVVMVNWEFFDNQTPGQRPPARRRPAPRARRSSRRAARTASARSRRCPACWPASTTGGPTRASAPVCRRCAVSRWRGPRAGPRRTSPAATTAAAPARATTGAGGRRRAVERRAPGHHARPDVSPAAEQKKQSTDDAKES